MFFSRKQTIVVPIEQPKKQNRQSSVLAKKEEHLPQNNSYLDMMEETLLQTIRSSSMALLDLYQRRKQQNELPPPPPSKAPLMLPMPTQMALPPKPIQPPPTTIRPQQPVPVRTQQPRPQQPVPVKPQQQKIKLDDRQIKSLASKILNEIDDLLDSDDSLVNIIQQSLTWNTLLSKVETQSMKQLFSIVKEMCEEQEQSEPIDIISLVLNEIMGLAKTQVQNPNMFISILEKSPTWTTLNPVEKKANLKTIFTTFNSRKADFMRDVYPVAKPSGSMSTGSPTNKNDGSDKGRGVQELGEPSQYSPVHGYGVSNLDKADAYGRTPANNLNNIREVQNAPGSSRVIPQNSGFVNNASEKAKKVSELREAIMNLGNSEDDDEYEDENYEDENENGDDN